MFERLADEGMRMTAGHIGDLAPDRRHAVLLATIIAIETDLTDATLFMFDKLMGSLARRAENRTSARAALSVRDLQKPLRTVTATCRLVLRAIASKQDVAAAIGSRAARGVGQVMAYYGDQVPWWRVVQASGHAVRDHETRALEHFRAEGTPLLWSRDGHHYRVDLAVARHVPDFE